MNTTNKPSAAAMRIAQDMRPGDRNRVAAAIDAELQPLIEALEQAATDLAEAAEHFPEKSEPAVNLRGQAKAHRATLRQVKGEQ